MTRRDIGIIGVSGMLAGTPIRQSVIARGRLARSSLHSPRDERLRHVLSTARSRRAALDGQTGIRFRLSGLALLCRCHTTMNNVVAESIEATHDTPRGLSTPPELYRPGCAVDHRDG